MFGDPDPLSAGTAGDAALWGGSSAAMGMAAIPFKPIMSDHMFGKMLGVTSARTS